MPAPAMMAEVLEATRPQKRSRKKHRELAAATPESPQPPATPESKTASWVQPAPETLSSTAAAAATRVEERKRKKQEESATSPSVEMAVRMGEEKKKRKREKHQEAPATPSPSPQTLEVDGKMAAAAAVEGSTARRKRKRAKVEQEQSGQPPLPVELPPQEAAAAGGGAQGSQSGKRSRSNKPRVPSDREIIRKRLELKKQQPLPQSFVTARANPDSIDQDPNYSSPFGAFFDQFCYKPERKQHQSAMPLPQTPDRAKLPPPDRLSSGSSQLTANKTVKAGKTTTPSTKQPRSASSSGSQEEVKVKEKKMTEKEMIREKKLRKRAPSLSAAELRSDKYRRLPLDQLVSPPRSPHKLLQEKYASDPWKVIVICMLLNLTQGKQVRKKVKGFFKRYPDAQTAYKADPEKMAKYLAPLGLQHVKVKRIQKLSKAYAEQEWTYVTELCGVGKYAADAYAIFCAGRATEVKPKDHKLVDYWKYVCIELPLIEASKNVQEAGVTSEQGSPVPKLQELAVCC